MRATPIAPTWLLRRQCRWQGEGIFFLLLRIWRRPVGLTWQVTCHHGHPYVTEGRELWRFFFSFLFCQRSICLRRWKTRVRICNHFRCASVRLMSTRLMSTRIMSTRIMSTRLMSTRIISTRIMPTHIMSTHIMSTCTMSTRIMLNSYNVQFV